jgi:CRP-like cAMP-binding protein
MSQLSFDRPRRTDALSPYLTGTGYAPASEAFSYHSGRSSSFLQTPVLASTGFQTGNHLLDGLAPADMERLAPHLRLVQMAQGQMLYEPNEKLQYAYFPTTAIVSLQSVLRNGVSAESAGVASEGMVGIALFLGGETTPDWALVQRAGQAYTLPARLLKEEFNRGGFLQRALLRYTQALMMQITQTAICNRHHRMEQQLCRWLSLSVDRLHTPEVIATQESVARVLGVRREGVAAVAGRLQTAGVISCGRGRITVVDRPGVMARACECYAAVRTELSSLLSDVQQWKGMPARADIM